MNRFFSETVWVDFMRITIVILILIILYRQLLRYLSRKHLKTKPFCTLYQVEDQPASGEIPFYFTTNIPRKVAIYLQYKEDGAVTSIVDNEYEEGGHLIRFDSSRIKNGDYFYVLKTENQEIKKSLIVKN